MEAIALHSLRLVAARDGQNLRHALQAAMESGVKAGDLTRGREFFLERLNQTDLRDQVLGIVRADSAQFLQYRAIHWLRIAVARPAVDDAMANGRGCACPQLRREQLS